MNVTKSLLQTLVLLVESNCHYDQVVTELINLGFHVTKTDQGTIALQHLTFSLRGQITFFKYSSKIGDIYLLPDETLYKAFKVDIKTFDNFQYSKLFGGAKNMETQTSVIFVNNILEGRKIIIHKRR
jgi:hypothetical protein